MSHGLVVGHQENKTFVSIEWDPAALSPTDALYDFLVQHPHAVSYSIVETQCDGTVRPVMAGLTRQIPSDARPKCCDACDDPFERHQKRFGVTGGALGMWTPSSSLHYDCAHTWADNVNAACSPSEYEVVVFKV